MNIYFSGWKLNAARILDALIDVVEANGGYLVESEPFTQIHPSIYRVTDENYPGTRVLAMRALTHLSFAYDGLFYHVQLGNNPFLGCVYIKEKPVEDKIASGISSESLSLEWFLGKSEYAYLSDQEVKDNAESLLHFLLDASLTETSGNKTRKIRRKENQYGI